MLVLLERVYTANIYVAAKVNWWLKYTLSTDSLVRVYFNQRLWLKYTLTKESSAKVYFNQCLWLKYTLTKDSLAKANVCS